MTMWAHPRGDLHGFISPMSLRNSAEILGLPTRLADREYAPTPGDASG